MYIAYVPFSSWSMSIAMALSTSLRPKGSFSRVTVCRRPRLLWHGGQTSEATLLAMYTRELRKGCRGLVDQSNGCGHCAAWALTRMVDAASHKFIELDDFYLM